LGAEVKRQLCRIIHDNLLDIEVEAQALCGDVVGNCVIQLLRSELSILGFREDAEVALNLQHIAVEGDGAGDGEEFLAHASILQGCGESQELPVTSHEAVEVFLGILGDFLPVVGDGSIQVIQVSFLLHESLDERIGGGEVFDLGVADHEHDYMEREPMSRTKKPSASWVESRRI